MAIRRILKAPSFFLTGIKTKPIDTQFESEMKAAKKLSIDMIDTLNAYNGVGLSAIQINEHKRIIVIKPNKEKKETVMINPVILETSEEIVESDEACLSIPGKYGKVKRHKDIKVSFIDLDNNKITGTMYDLESFIVQHEIDHIDNILFTSRCEEVKDIREEQADEV